MRSAIKAPLRPLRYAGLRNSRVVVPDEATYLSDISSRPNLRGTEIRDNKSAPEPPKTEPQRHPALTAVFGWHRVCSVGCTVDVVAGTGSRRGGDGIDCPLLAVGVVGTHAAAGMARLLYNRS
jgi:hypothetical protein